MQLQQQAARVGPLVCRLVDVDRSPTDKPRALCVLCHGYGAPGTDLVGLAHELVALAPALFGAVRFAFPEAPLSLEDAPFGGRAWWPIDVGRFQRAAMTGDVDSLLEEVPEGMPAARRALRATVDELAAQAGLPLSRVVLGGFSQGAMVATDVALRHDEAAAALCVLSGALIARSEWTKLLDKRAGLRVLQSHGTGDPILPFAVGAALRELLEDKGCPVEFLSFPGGHGIAEEVLQRLAALVAEVAA